MQRASVIAVPATLHTCCSVHQQPAAARIYRTNQSLFCLGGTTTLLSLPTTVTTKSLGTTTSLLWSLSSHFSLHPTLSSPPPHSPPLFDASQLRKPRPARQIHRARGRKKKALPCPARPAPCPALPCPCPCPLPFCSLLVPIPPKWSKVCLPCLPIDFLPVSASSSPTSSIILTWQADRSRHTLVRFQPSTVFS